MKKLAVFTLIIVFILTYNSFQISAQESCTEKLKYAQELFSSGQIEQIPVLLDSCLQKGFSKEEKYQAYRLLIQVYLFDYNKEKAETTMSRFLKLYPRYTLQSSDPVEFVELYNAFKIKPTWSFGFTAGSNLSHTLVSEYFSTENLSNLNATYKPQTGFDAGLQISRYLRKNIWLSLDIRYTMINYRKRNLLNNSREELIYNESTNWITLPLYINYSMVNRKLSPFLFAGGELGYLVSAKSNISRHDFAEEFPDVSNNSVAVTSTREPINTWLSGGIGIKCKISDGYLCLTLGYAYNMMPFINKDKRYSNNNLLYYYQYIDDDFKLNRYFCSFSYAMLLHKIKKR